jgi:hypothetical protein
MRRSVRAARGGLHRQSQGQVLRLRRAGGWLGALSHRNILNNAFFVGRTLGLTEGDRYCIQVPLYHCGGMVVGTLMSIAHSATMVLPIRLV